MKKKAVYTALFGNHDTWREPLKTNPDYDYFLFTDQPIESKHYTIIKMEGDARKAREIKILSHHFLKDYDLTVWHDASLNQVADINSLVSYNKWDIIILDHHIRSCIYAEANACLLFKKDNPLLIKQQMQRYKQENYPEKNGLVASGLIFRKNNYRTRLLCEYWHNELKNGSMRDQLSFNYVQHFLENNTKNPALIRKIPYITIRTHFHYQTHNKIIEYDKD